MRQQKGRTMSKLSQYKVWGGAGLLLLISTSVFVLTFPVHLASAQSGEGSIARGGGTTIVQGGTGSPGFVPVETTIAFHAEKSGNIVAGGFECFARVPAVSTGPGSAQFTVNAMYVTGHVTGAVVGGDTATLTGTAQITGLGAGSGVCLSNSWFTAAGLERPPSSRQEVRRSWSLTKS